MRTLADAVLIVHVAIAVFVVGGLAMVVIGHAVRWRWVDDPWFRSLHLAAIATVVAESTLGVVCPVTTLEMWLRSRAGASTYAGGFVEHWLHRLLYHDAPAWVFTTGYVAFGLAVIVAWWRFPPRLRRRTEPLG